MSALGQKRTLMRLDPMPTLPPKADMAGRQLDVRFVPEADIINYEFKLDRRLSRKIAWIRFPAEL
jgi:hypothetical protein